MSSALNFFNEISMLPFFWVWRGDCKDENERRKNLQHRIFRAFHPRSEIVLVERMKILLFCAIQMDFFAQLLIHFISASVEWFGTEKKRFRLPFSLRASTTIQLLCTLMVHSLPSSSAFLIPLESFACVCVGEGLLLRSHRLPAIIQIDAAAVPLSAAYSIWITLDALNFVT